MTRVMFNRMVTDEQKSRLTKDFPEVDFVFTDSVADPKLLASEGAKSDVLVGVESPDLLNAILSVPNQVRWLHSWFAGVNHLPLDLLEEHHVWLTRAGGVAVNPIVETTICLMIMLTRNFRKYGKQQDAHQWIQLEWPDEVHGKTIGILGMGIIGKGIAKMAKAFDMEVWGLQQFPQPNEYTDHIVGNDELDKLLNAADYVVNILPLTAATKYLMNEERFNQMKKGAYYLNVGRGATTDTQALIEALQSGKIKGAGLDVIDVEPLPPDSPLWDMDQVIILAHQAGFTTQYDERTLQLFERNLKNYLEKGKPNENLVNLEAGY